MQEEWKPIEGYEGLYEISNFGRVKSLNYLRNYREKILINMRTNKGYLYVTLYKYKIQKHFQSHRLVALAFIPNPENKRCVNHIDNIRDNNITSNLEWVTHKENMEHAAKQGRMNCGEKQGSSRLKSEDIIRIRTLRKEGLTFQTIAKVCGVSETHTFNICARKAWKHIK